MASKAFTLMLGTAAMLVAVACASTEKGRSSEDTKAQAAEAHRPTKAPSPSATPRIGPHESPSPSAGNQTRDAAAPTIQRETGITALDQSEAPDDLETTRRIRQAVIQDDSLSFKSKNVTIVTNGNRVVLTGPVNTRAEADRIKAIAQSMTPYRIEDRLEIRR
jgi:Predicted periplasmic or secreted lipoprotein